MKIEKHNVWSFNIPYLINIKTYVITAYLKQFHFEIKFFGGLIWFGLDFTPYNQLISIGISKIYFQFGPGMRFDEKQ